MPGGTFFLKEPGFRSQEGEGHGSGLVSVLGDQ
jgi:hypothetical protein